MWRFSYAEFDGFRPFCIFTPIIFVLSKVVSLISYELELIAKAVSDLKDSKLNYLPIAVDLY